MLIIFGDSHVRSLKSGFSLLPDPPIPVEAVKFAAIAPFPRFLSPFFAKTRKGIGFTKGGLRQMYREGTGEEGILEGTTNTYVFSAPLNPLGLLFDRDWNSYSPPGIIDEKQAISTAVMEEIVLQHFKPLTDFLEALVGLNVNCVVASSPPTRFDNTLIARKASGEARRKIDAMCRSTMSKAIAALGLTVIPSPEGTGDENSNLLPQYHHETGTDFHHANSAYGALMMKSILDHLRALKTDSSNERSVP